MPERGGEQWLEDGVQVGAWLVEPQLNRISRDGLEAAGPNGHSEDHRLEPKVMQVLVCMARRPYKTVTKDQFMEQVWGDTVVTNDVLLRCISELRKVLGDDARDPDYIETIRGSGYRLIAPVTEAVEPQNGRADRASTERAGAGSSNTETARPDVPPLPIAAREDEAQAVETAGEENVSTADEAPAERALTEPAAEAAAPTRNAAIPAGTDERAEDERAAAPARAELSRTASWRWRLLRLLLRLRSNRMLGRAGLLAAVLLMTATAFWAYQAATAVPPAPSEPVPFTSFPGEEFDPAISPDGERIAFVWDGGDGENFDIYVKQMGTDEPLRITSDPAIESSPAWSPDGNHLAFVRSGEEENRVIITPAIGSGEREVAQFGAREVQGLVWSPDGGTLALAAQQAPYEAYRIVLLSINSLEQRPLTDPPAYYHGDLDPAFSPDGQRVAFMRSLVDHVQDLYVVPIEGGSPTRLTTDRAELTGLDWTPNGQSIIFASNRDGASKLWRVKGEGGEPSWVATYGGSGGELQQPSIAREGGRMIVTERSSDTNIWHLRRAPSYGRLASTQLIFSTRWDSNPAISPGGDRIAFASRRSGSFEIWTSLRDGTEPVQLTQFDGPFTSMPRWSPDSSRIAFVSQSDESASIYVVDAAGGTPRRLSMGTSNDVAPSWSRDGKSVYFASNRSGDWQLWRTPAEGGAAQQVTQDGGFAGRESVDGRTLYFVKKNTPGIWERPLEGGEATRIVEAVEPYDWGNWDVTAQGLYYVRRRTGEPPLLAFRRFSNGRTLRVAYLRNLPQHPALAVAPSGDWYLHAKVDRSESDILLVENFR